MMRRAAKIDRNHPEIVKALRQAGCSVQSLAAVGKGCPDLLVSRGNQLFLFEVKDGAKPPSERKCTKDEARWHAAWGGPVHIVYNVEQALAIVSRRPG